MVWTQITAANLVKWSKGLPLHPSHARSTPQHAEYSQMAACNSRRGDDKQEGEIMKFA